MKDLKYKNDFRWKLFHEPPSDTRSYFLKSLKAVRAMGWLCERQKWRRLCVTLFSSGLEAVCSYGNELATWWHALGSKILTLEVRNVWRTQRSGWGHLDTLHWKLPVASCQDPPGCRQGWGELLFWLGRRPVIWLWGTDLYPWESLLLFLKKAMWTFELQVTYIYDFWTCVLSLWFG